PMVMPMTMPVTAQRPRRRGRTGALADGSRPGRIVSEERGGVTEDGIVTGAGLRPQGRPSGARRARRLLLRGTGSAAETTCRSPNGRQQSQTEGDVPSVQTAINDTSLSEHQRASLEAIRPSRVNVGTPERWLSMLAGGALALFGATRRSWPGRMAAL